MKKQYRLLNKYKKELTKREYCINFKKLFSINKNNISKNNIVKKISENLENEFFFENKNILNLLYGNNINLIISYIYHFDEINKSLNIDNKNILSFLVDINFSFEELLNKEMYLTFIFLYFLPDTDKDKILNKSDTPLISKVILTKKSFDFLMVLYLEDGKLIKETEFNQLLILDFVKSAKELYGFMKKVDWKKILPIKKIYKFIDLNFSIKQTEKIIPSSYLILFKNLQSILNEIEVEYNYSKLNSELNMNKIKVKNLKI